MTQEATKPQDATVLKTSLGVGGQVLAVLFWIWGIIGLFVNTMNYFTLSGSVGVGQSAYITLGLLYWIGGMLLFGLGALMTVSEGLYTASSKVQPSRRGFALEYHGYTHVILENGEAQLKLSSGEWRTFPSIDDLKMYVDAIRK